MASMMRGQPSEDATPASPRWTWWVALLCCAAGLWLSIVLAQLHFKTHQDPAFHSFCALDRTVNCDIVARSPYAVLLGVPVATWGIFGYALAAIVTLWGLRKRSSLATACGLGLGILYMVSSVALGAVSALLVSAVCILCIATYGVNLLFLIAMVLAARRWGLRATLAELPGVLRARPARVALVLGLVIGAMVALIVAHPAYWSGGKTSRAAAAAPGLPHGIEPGGGHYLGAEQPVVTVIEFSDYECPYCRQAHKQMRDLLERYPTRLRLVHRHYPLDSSCNSSIQGRMHENACFAALVAECAGRQNRFWQANDYLFAEARSLHSRANAEIARDLGLDAARLETCLREEGPRNLALDVDEGNRLQIQGTPTFVIEGKTYMGNLPPSVLARLQGTGGIDGGTRP